MDDTPARKTPWHLWLIGVLALAWTGFGAFDQAMTLSRNEDYLAAFTPEQIAYFTSFPVWVLVVWTVGVWGGIAGSVLLLARRRWAVHAYAASLGAMLLSLLYTNVLTDGAAVMGESNAAMSLVILAICAVLVLYAWAMARRGVLR